MYCAIATEMHLGNHSLKPHNIEKGAY